jgi:6,7-dimethyl-8-ribityllumazine synthase
MAIKKRLSTPKIRIAIVASRFNDFITKALVNACWMELKRHGLEENDLTTIWVPGSFEVPLMALKLAKKKQIDAVICLGAVIRGDTYHFEVIANEVARGMMEVSLKTEKPIVMGVLTTDTIDQAQKRAQDKGGHNKGREAAMTAIEMLSLLRKI